MFTGMSKFAKIAWSLTRSGNPPTKITGQSQGETERREKVGAEPVPGYKHEPPQTKPHILLHYCTFKKTWDWVILGLTFYTVIIVPANLAINKTSSNTTDVTMLVLDSIVDIFFFIDIIFNFHTSFVGNNGEVITDETKIRKHYLKSGFFIDIMACLPYDLLHNFIGTSYTDIFSILKVMR